MTDPLIQLTTRRENFRLRDTFAISRGAKDSVDVVLVELQREGLTGNGEAVPNPRYSQTSESTVDEIHGAASTILNGCTHETLIEELPANAARNGVDAAMWHLEARDSGQPVWQLAGLPEPQPVLGTCTLSMDSPTRMAEAARQFSDYPLLKLKLGKDDAVECVKAVRGARPDARLIVDANEAWDIDMLDEYVPQLASLDVECIEQPLPAEKDEVLASRNYEIPLCADESFLVADDLPDLVDRYDIFNIKLDKTGGLTAAIDVAQSIRDAARQIMIGSMMSTSLSLAPAMLLAHDAVYVDLDSPIWLEEDRVGGLGCVNGICQPAKPLLWG